MNNLPPGSKRFPLARSIQILALAGVVFGASQASADYFSVDTITGNADSGVDSGRNYVSISNIVGGDVIVNGVTFAGAETSGTGWTLNGAGVRFDAGGNHTGITDSIASLFDNFQYNGAPAVFSLSGLIAGQTYQATFYNEAFGLGADRSQTLTADLGASIRYNEDAVNASVLKYTFVATDTTTNISVSPAVVANTMHFYGFSNEILNAWSPASGSSWDTAANWSTGVIANAVGSTANFGAQAAATAVTLNSAKTVGYLSFGGTSSYNISGTGSITLQATANTGLSSVDVATSAIHTIGTSVVLNGDTQKIGAGNLHIQGNVSGTGGFIVNSGVLTLSGTNSYEGATRINNGVLRIGASISIENPGFELPNQGNGGFTYAPSVPGWTLASNTGVAQNNSPWYAPAAVDGLQAAFLQNDDGAGAGISQTINVDSAGLYNIGFLAIGRNGNGPNGLIVKVDGITTLTLAESQFDNLKWQDFSTSAVNLTAGSHTISFVGNNQVGGDKTTVIDRVQIGRTGLNTNAIPDSSIVSLSSANSTLDLNGNNETVGSLIGVSGSKVFLGNGTLTTGGNNSDSIYAGVIAGAGGVVTKTGTGTLTLTGTNSYSGGTNINAGKFKSVLANSAGSGRVFVAAGATWELGGENQTVAGLSGAGTVTRNTTLTGAVVGPTFFTTNANSGVSGAANYTHLLDFGDGGGAVVNGVAFTSAGNNGGNWSLTGATNLFPESAGVASAPTFPDAPDGTGFNQLYRDFYYNGNPGELKLNNLVQGENYEARLYNRFFGGPRVQTLTFDDGSGTPAGFTFDQDATSNPNYISYKFTAATPTLTITATPQAPGTSLHWYGATVEQIVLTPSTLTVGDSNNYTFDGVLSGINNLAKQGTGIQTLAGANTYTGTTSVSGGTLQITGSISGTTGVTVNNNATLQIGGTGNRIADTAPITLGGNGAGGTLSMQGLSAQSEVLGALTLGESSTINFGLGNSDTLLFSKLTLATYSLAVFNWTGTPYNLSETADHGGTQDHLTFALNVGATDASRIYFYSDDGATFLGSGKTINYGGGQFEVVPIPEPSVSALAALALGLAGLRRRRKMAR
ncbi:MAG: autotransporter-associated beta strand repeat protein [Chthoniobacteraceae bacterium]|nr:autotransporter-associated beta strand repeat protein [Chthoniobacteraceae bacterium]